MTRSDELQLRLDWCILQAEAALAELPPGPENRATLVALEDAWRWQCARLAVRASSGGLDRPEPPGLGWEEI